VTSSFLLTNCPQVNDDSTREDIKSRVDKTAAEMRELGHMVQVGEGGTRAAGSMAVTEEGP
jgi:hypothetical protein